MAAVTLERQTEWRSDIHPNDAGFKRLSARWPTYHQQDHQEKLERVVNRMVVFRILLLLCSQGDGGPIVSQQQRKAKLRFRASLAPDGTPKLVTNAKAACFPRANVMPTTIQITPTRIAAWLGLSQSSEQMIKPEIGRTRLASLFSELRT